MGTQEHTEESVFVWRFASESDLRRGLEEYTAHLDDTVVTRYGERVGQDESDGGEHMCKVRIRHEIDHCMEELEQQYPFFHRLLDLYFRRGLSCEQHGWCIVARRLGLRGDPGSRWDRDTFERQVDLAVSRLWRVHHGRYQRRT